MGFQQTAARRHGRGGTAETAPTRRDRRLRPLAESGRTGGRETSGRDARARVEAAVGRFERAVGDGPRSRADRRRTPAVDVAVHVLDRTLEAGRPGCARVA